MINISDTHKEKIIDELMNTKLEIVFPDGDCETITEENIASESMKLKQAICDDSALKFGGCIASEFNINLINTVDRTFDNSLVGKWISVRLTQTFPTGSLIYPSATLYPGTNVYPGEAVTSKVFYVFNGFIDSAKVDKSDKNMRNLVAYDVFAKLYQQDGTSLLMSILKSSQTGYTWLRNVLLLCMLKGNNKVMNVDYNWDNWGTFMNEVINQQTGLCVYSYDIKNDDWIDDNNTISIGEIIRCICEIMGTFGVIKPNEGKGCFMLIELGDSAENYDFNENLYAEEYQSLGYTDFMLLNGNTSRTDKIMHYEPDISPDDAPLVTYDLTDNACCWQDWDGQGAISAMQMFNLLSGQSGVRMYNCEFTPITATLDGRLWVEVGDKIALKTKKTDVNGDYVLDENGDVVTETVTSYVLSRTISGIHALTDNIEAKGGQ